MPPPPSPRRGESYVGYVFQCRRTVCDERGVLIVADRQGAAPPPAGELSFLLTDVVDSVALWERAQGAMDAALAQHDAGRSRAASSSTVVLC